jgi:hypothetical protein
MESFVPVGFEMYASSDGLSSFKKYNMKQTIEVDVPSKLCPKCQAIVRASYRACGYCGFEFPKKDVFIPLKNKEVKDWKWYVKKHKEYVRFCLPDTVEEYSNVDKINLLIFIVDDLKIDFWKTCYLTKYWLDEKNDRMKIEDYPGVDIIMNICPLEFLQSIFQTE